LSNSVLYGETPKVKVLLFETEIITESSGKNTRELARKCLWFMTGNFMECASFIAVLHPYPNKVVLAT
jgi:hypothetical protein